MNNSLKIENNVLYVKADKGIVTFPNIDRAKEILACNNSIEMLENIIDSEKENIQKREEKTRNDERDFHAIPNILLFLGLFINVSTSIFNLFLGLISSSWSILMLLFFSHENNKTDNMKRIFAIKNIIYGKIISDKKSEVRHLNQMSNKSSLKNLPEENIELSSNFLSKIDFYETTIEKYVLCTSSIFRIVQFNKLLKQQMSEADIKAFNEIIDSDPLVKQMITKKDR